MIADVRTWLTCHRTRVAGKSPFGEALAHNVSVAEMIDWARERTKEGLAAARAQ
ncbi:hypothetical protein [Rhizobium ruizarguesonis]|uniref:hypothetical protein n=1 Tax=Rhizobium ruizarguesonis TaxID=2081791 RepID=UPI0013EE4DC6|nr:hypothetical protein [Rhizobium ruizarguesonis]